MLRKTTMLSLGCALAALLTTSSATTAGAQPYGGYYGNDNGYGRPYNDRDRAPYDRPYTDRNYGPRDRNYEPPRRPGRTFTANDQPGERLTGTPGDDVFHAGHNSVVMTGRGGADRFVFDVEPWNAGHITDFEPGEDILDLRPLFRTTNFRGPDPIRAGLIEFRATDQGTEVYFDPDGPANGHPWPTHVTTLDNIRPDQIQSTDWLWR